MPLDNKLANFKYTKGEILCNYTLDDNIAVTISCENTGLNINNMLFNNNKSDPSDRTQWAAYHKSYITVLDDTEFIYSANMSVNQNITPEFIPVEYIPRIRNIHEDYRLCSGGITIYDVLTNVMVAILITDDYIYGYYGVLPSNNGSSQACFEAVIPLLKINQGMHQVAIGVTAKTINYYINGECKYKISEIGQRLPDMYQMVDYGGIASNIKLKTLKLGFGTFTFLDHQLPNNYAREYVHSDHKTVRLNSALLQLLPLQCYYEPYPNFGGDHSPVNTDSFAIYSTDSKYKLWGQGVTCNIENISGTYNKPKKSKIAFTQLYNKRRPSI